MANIEKLTRAGECVIDNAEILSYRIAGGSPGSQEPYRMNITGIIGKLEFDQNLFYHSMYGKLQVLDTKDIRTILPITGLEKFSIYLSTGFIIKCTSSVLFVIFLDKFYRLSYTVNESFFNFYTIGHNPNKMLV